MKKILIIISIIISIFSSITAYANENQDNFDKAIEYYKGGQIDEALAIYQDLESSGINSGLVYYNMANIYMERAEYANAILYYEKAMRLLGYDKDLYKNIAHAYELTGNEEDYKKTNVAFFHIFKIVNAISLISILLISTLLFILTIINIFKPNTIKKNIIIIVLIITAISFIPYYYTKFATTQNYAITLNDNVYIKEGKTENAKNIHRLQSGAKIAIIENHENWYYVRISQGKYGWLSKNDAKSIL